MELNKNTKQALSTLQNQIINDSDYTLVTKTKVIFKNNVYQKTDGVWVQCDTEALEFLSDIGLNKNEEIDILKQKIDKLNLKVLRLEDEGEKEDDNNLNLKKKISGKPATQAKIKTAIINFFNNNVITDENKIENFEEFLIIFNKNVTERIEYLKNIFDNMKGRACEKVYRSFLELEILYQLYIKELGEKKGRNQIKQDLNNIIVTKKNHQFT